MRRRQMVAVTGVCFQAAVSGCVSNSSFSSDDQSIGTVDTEWPTEPYSEYDTTTVSINRADGSLGGTVLAAIADTSSKRRRGLSDAELMPTEGGMLFVFESDGNRTFIMREMDFGIDIVYADADGVITEIHHAPAPGPEEDGSSQRYSGRGQYVVELTYEWTANHEVSVGDQLMFEL